MHKEYLDLVIGLISPVFILIAMRFFGVSGSSLLMFLMAFVFCLYRTFYEPEPEKDAAVVITILIAFLAGGICDLLLNLYSSYSTGVRSVMLNNYFGIVGTYRASIFAALLTVWLVLPSYVLYQAFAGKEPLFLFPIGFAVGFIIGAFSESSLALRPLFPFYKSTTGWIENRAWDGISVCAAMIPVVAYLKIR